MDKPHRHDHPAPAHDPAPPSVDGYQHLSRTELLALLEERTSQLAATQDRLNAETALRLQGEGDLRASEARFRQLFQEAPIMMHMIDEDGIIRQVNSKWQELTGYSESEALNRRLDFLMTPESAAKANSCVLPDFWRDGYVHDVHYDYVRKNGQVMHVVMDCIGTTDQDGKRMGIAAARDETERMLAVQDLEARKSSLEADVRQRTEEQEFIINNFLVGICILKNRVIVRANKKVEEMFGFAPGELHGQLTGVLYPSADGYRHYGEQAYAALSKGETFQFESPMRRKDGSLFLCRIFGRAIDSTDLGRGTIWLMEDVTERRMIEEKLKAARDKAEQANKAKTEFLANMSHEIRTPMNGIIGMVDLLAESGLDSTQREYADLALSSARSLLALLNDILDFSKVESGSMVLRNEPLLIRDIMEKVAATFRQPVENAATVLSVTVRGLPDPDQVTLTGDAARLRQILFNLTGNAMKFTPKGRVELSAELAEDGPESALIRFRVKDTGVGISHEDQQRLFQAFTQLEPSMTRRHGGVGLGLILCKSLVEMMGGGISVDSALGEGSTFTFTVRLPKCGPGVPSRPDCAVISPQADQTTVCPAPPSSILERANTLERLEGDESILNELYAMFLEEIPRKTSGLSQSLQDGDLDGLAGLAQALKGAAAAIGGLGVQRSAARLEQAARGSDNEAVLQALALLDGDLDALRQELHHYLGQTGS